MKWSWYLVWTTYVFFMVAIISNGFVGIGAVAGLIVLKLVRENRKKVKIPDDKEGIDKFNELKDSPYDKDLLEQWK